MAGITSLQTPPFRAEHIGSLLRPRELKEAFRAYREGRLAPAAYSEELNAAVERAVKLQENAGLRSITDGEFGRSSWFGFFFERMDGFRMAPAAFQFRDEEGRCYEWPTCVAESRIERRGGITTAEYLRLCKLTRATPKVTMPSPSAFHFFRFHAPVDVASYPDIEVYWNDLIAVYRAELAELGRLGCTYAQLDEVPLAMLCDPLIRQQVRGMGGDPDALVVKYIAVLKQVLSGRPLGLTVGLHLCRGNFRGRWMAAGGYEPVAEQLFNGVPVDAFFLEYDSARAGDFSPLRFVPRDKRVILGMISSKTPALEAEDRLIQRIEEAAQVVSLEQLGLSPQCGFASVAGGNLLTEDDQNAKLELVVRVADAVWGSA
jgi:5-methyltetrahydropteroyltriglutamate--homocysteine methyltransferase